LGIIFFEFSFLHFFLLMSIKKFLLYVFVLFFGISTVYSICLRFYFWSIKRDYYFFLVYSTNIYICFCLFTYTLEKRQNIFWFIFSHENTLFSRFFFVSRHKESCNVISYLRNRNTKKSGVLSPFFLHTRCVCGTPPLCLIWCLPRQIVI
jgi:hypothetical protein